MVLWHENRSVETFEVDAICAPGEAYATDLRLVPCSVQQEDCLVQNDSGKVVKESTL